MVCSPTTPRSFHGTAAKAKIASIKHWLKFNKRLSKFQSKDYDASKFGEAAEIKSAELKSMFADAGRADVSVL